LVGSFCLLNISIELDISVGAGGRAQVLFGGVYGRELAGDVREVGEGEFAWVRLITDAEEDDRITDEVTK